MTTHDDQPMLDEQPTQDDQPTQDEQRLAEASAGTEATAPRVANESRTRADTDVPAGSSAQGDQLVPRDAVMDFNARWEAIQQGFVDDPRNAVGDADSLVSDVLDRLSSTFDEQHHQLESGWSDGEPDTEELRAAFQRYRDFFDRLLTI